MCVWLPAIPDTWAFAEVIISVALPKAGSSQMFDGKHAQVWLEVGAVLSGL